ncbi:MAG: PD-(D/E)XK nuclease family protein [Saprospiraceae bacterium]|nr:PD-(D/E)XK nuclease family protein [Saprospiraceae bacterium]
MDNTNLFNHAPKELVTDAFLTWLFYFLDSQDEFQSYKQNFFKALFLKDEDHNKTISEIKVERQLKVKNGRIDLLVEFNLEKKEHKILFENKTWTSTNNDQLQLYKNGCPNLYKYIYLKLAYINNHECRLLKNHGFTSITSEELSNSLVPLAGLHPFIKQYLDYINHKFIQTIHNFEVDIFEKNKFEILRQGQAQEYLMDKLFVMRNENSSCLWFITGSSAGSPFTELYIAKKENIYGKTCEFLIWRIDYRSEKFCLRLNLYAYIKKQSNREFISKKKERLRLIREIASDISSKYNIKPGKLSNRGINANEITIFYFKDNDMDDLMKALPSFSSEIVKEYTMTL